MSNTRTKSLISPWLWSMLYIVIFSCIDLAFSCLKSYLTKNIAIGENFIFMYHFPLIIQLLSGLFSVALICTVLKLRGVNIKQYFRINRFNKRIVWALILLGTLPSITQLVILLGNWFSNINIKIESYLLIRLLKNTMIMTIFPGTLSVVQILCYVVMFVAIIAEFYQCYSERFAALYSALFIGTLMILVNNDLFSSISFPLIVTSILNALFFAFIWIRCKSIFAAAIPPLVFTVFSPWQTLFEKNNLLFNPIDSSTDVLSIYRQGFQDSSYMKLTPVILTVTIIIMITLIIYIYKITKTDDRKAI